MPLGLDELKRIIQTEFTVSDYYMDVDGTPVFLLPPNQETKVPFRRLIEKLKTYNVFAILRYSSQLKREYKLSPAPEDENTKQLLALKVIPKSVEGKRRGPLWNLAFLIATILTVTYAGYYWATSYDSFGIEISLISGPWYGWYTDPLLLSVAFTVALLSILGTHELGHYLTAKKRGMEATLPFFIPVPTLIGTLGAVIFQRSPPINRDNLFDLGLMGPLSGFIIAVFVAVLSIKFAPLIYPNVLYDILQSEFQINFFILNFLLNVYTTYSPAIAFILGQLLVNSGYFPYLLIVQSPFGESLLMMFLRLLLRPETAFTGFADNPLSMATWVGLFVTALNLSPAGMLDGGHMFRAILSRRAHYIASILVLIILITILAPISWIYIITVITIAVLVLLTLGRRGHPGALDEVSPLKTSRKIIFIVMMFIIVIAFPPLYWVSL